MKKILQKLLLLTIVLSSSMGLSAATPSEEVEAVKEVHVLSITFDGQFLASMVARPCDKSVECENLLVRIDAKTQWTNRGQTINYQQAKTLEWNFVLVTLDKFNNALSIDRML